MNILMFFAKGGIVMWPILFCSVVMLAILGERLWRYGQVRLAGEDLAATVGAALGRGRREQAVAAALADDGPVGRVLAAAAQVDPRDRETLETVLIEAQQAEVRQWERYLPVMAAIGNIAPLLGLLGTVMGMIKAFMVIQEMGGKVNAVVLAGGIWEAMITTAFGLIVALPAMAAHAYLAGRVDRFHDRLESRAVSLVKAISNGGRVDASC